MKTVYLQKMVQYDRDSYVGVIDPRLLLGITNKAEYNVTQDGQRPLKEKKVRSINQYVIDGGLLPCSITMTCETDAFAPILVDEEKNLYKIEIPESEKEKNRLEVKHLLSSADGQHRLYSFETNDETFKNLIQLDPKIKYDMPVNIYYKVSKKDKEKIFLSCNEKQDKVDPNLLAFIKKLHGLLPPDDSVLQDIIDSMAQTGPLRKRIIRSAESIKGGLKTIQIISELKRIKFLDFINKNRDPEKYASLLNTYFESWEKVAGFKFSDPLRDNVATKIAGLRYMIHVLPAVKDYLFATYTKWTNKAAIETILREALTLTANAASKDRELTPDSFFTDQGIKQVYFRDRSTTMKLAEITSEAIKSLSAKGFDPSEGL